MAYQTMTDVAYNYLSKRKRAMDFLKLYEEVVKKMEIPENLQKKKLLQNLKREQKLKHKREEKLYRQLKK